MCSEILWFQTPWDHLLLLSYHFLMYLIFGIFDCIFKLFLILLKPLYRNKFLVIEVSG